MNPDKEQHNVAVGLGQGGGRRDTAVHPGGAIGRSAGMAPVSWSRIFGNS
jgi:hypothetical protein